MEPLDVAPGDKLIFCANSKFPFDISIAQAVKNVHDPVFLDFKYEGNTADAHITYFIHDMEPLPLRLEKKIDAATLAAVIESFANLVDVCERYSLPFKNVSLDKKCAFVDKVGRVMFVYLPFNGIEADIDLARSFFYDMCLSMLPIDDDGLRIKEEACACFATSKTLDLSAISSAWRKAAKRRLSVNANLSAENTDEISIEKRGRHVRIDPGTMVLDQLDPKVLASISAHEVFQKEKRTEDAPQKASRTLQIADYAKSESDMTTVLNPVNFKPPKKIDVFAKEKASTVNSHRPFCAIRCIRTGQRFDICDGHTVIGKSKYSDFQITGNNTISRSHAIITCENGRCFIEDNGSRNGTLINGQVLSPHERHRINLGDVLVLSDEKLTIETIE